MRTVFIFLLCVLVGCGQPDYGRDRSRESGLNMDVVEPVAVVVASLIAIGLLTSIANCDGDC